MEQYWSVKEDHPDKVVLFRMGDFFEMFHEDALIAAPILNIALTQRNKKSADDTPMCGVPHHSIAGPIGKLLAAGKKIAICDQIEDPREAKGIVKRAVTRCLSPGMVYDPDTLDQIEANYIASYDEDTVAFLEATTGEAFYYREAKPEEQQRLIKLLSPVELILAPQQKREWFDRQALEGLALSSHVINPELLSGEQGALPESAHRLLSYALTMQGVELRTTLGQFEERRLQKRLVLSPTVTRHLEIFESYKGEARGSLFHALNRTKTSAGARMLKQWLQFPLLDVEEINARQIRVDRWQSKPGELESLRKVLMGMGDVERRLGKISNPNCSPRDMESLKNSLMVGLRLREWCDGKGDPTSWQTCVELVGRIDNTLVEEPPVSTKDGGVIRRGFHPQLDEWIQLSEDSQSLLLALEAREKETTGIPSLKVRYNNVFGYYIEVTNTHKDKVPGHYLRKQTLTNAERYTTDELQELERKVLAARTKRVDLEKELFADLRQAILATTADLMALAKEWSELDVVSSLAWLAIEYKYRRPSFSHAGGLQIKASRHPVVEQEVNKRFVPNDIRINQSECLLLTGPNMAGKSTIMRQVAITAILAQIGSFVPAESAILPLFDRIFTRIGASDFLSEGLSTFMVEMQETAEMLKEAGHHSLVILDEVGRGTSTYDGMSLAQSILEYLVEKKQAMTLFATHYHELTQLEARLPRVKNAHMTITEKSGEIQFLHTLVGGPANKSYGIQVARLAGLPREVTHRAGQLLKKLESFQASGSGQMSFMEMDTSPEDVASDPVFEPSLNPEEVELLRELKDLSVTGMTPLEALNHIAKWQKSLS
ncbi:MAG: DNA mismatch repair protein MutS [Bdellovibrionaceae bacterium]|nr:DNA mismatch repair protein MutS [Bdellovibrionales bacterium]MCB9083873.1 DNA mismatch repair protein MutS [Pseudobdellovibrionaceae bacterium]